MNENQGNNPNQDVPPSAPEQGGSGASDYGRMAKEAAEDAVNAVKTLIADPVGGQGAALEALGEMKSLYAGIVLLVIYALGFWLVMSKLLLLFVMGMGGGMPGSGLGLGAGGHFKLILMGLLSGASLVGCFFCLGLVFGDRVGLGKATLSSGIAFLPFALAGILVGVLGGVLPGLVINIIMIFAISMTILLINAYIVDVLERSTRTAFLFTPTTLVAFGFVTYILFQIFF